MESQCHQISTKTQDHFVSSGARGEKLLHWTKRKMINSCGECATQLDLDYELGLWSKHGRKDGKFENWKQKTSVRILFDYNKVAMSTWQILQ